MITVVSRLPTINRVGAVTCGNSVMAKSGRPPSETRVLIFSLECAAVRNADVASILAPKKQWAVC